LVTLNFRQNNAPTPQQIMSQLDVMTGQWYVFQAAAKGTLNVAAAEAEGVGLELYTAEMVPVALGGVDVLSAPVAEGESYVLHVTGDAQTVRLLMSIEEIVRQYSTNPDNALDVTGDGCVSPMDVLALVVELNGAGSLTTSATDYFYDVTGDGRATSLDVLTLISHLNISSSGSGEGDSVRQAVPDGLADVGWADFGEAHQNSPSISRDAHLSRWAPQSSGSSYLDLPYAPTASRTIGTQVDDEATPVRHSLTYDYDEVDAALAELDAVLPEILDDVDDVWQQLGSD
jgi:hypothetical protein